MPYEKANAIVIRLADFSETSRVITFYTREFGRIAALAKGAKRRYSKLIGQVDLLSYGEIVFIAGRTRERLNILTEACAFEDFPAIRTGLDRFYAACHAAGLVLAMTAEYDPNAELFDRLLALLRGLDAGLAPALALFAFEAHLLTLTGFMPELASCVACGKRNREKTAAFAPARGGIMCAACASGADESGSSVPGEPSLIRDVPSGALGLLDRLAKGQVTKLSRIRIAPEVVRQMRSFLNQYECYVLGRELRTMRRLHGREEKQE